MKVENLEDIYGLSPMQKGMLFHTLLVPNSSAYQNQSVWQLEGQLNLAAFEWAWQQVIQRHSVLRTAFFWEDLEEPLQVVLRQVTLPLQIIDWREYSAEQQVQQLEPWLAADLAQGFQLTAAPLLRLSLIQISPTSYWFCWSRHHLLLDGWSQAIVLKDLFTFYEVYCYGEQASFNQQAVLGPRRSYGEYIAWLQQQDQAKAEVFWQQLLNNWAGPARLSFARQGRSQHSYATQVLQLASELTSQVQTVMQQAELTINSLIQGVWVCLLSQYSNQHDVLFGVTVAGRPPSLPAIESMVGLFINTLPLRAKIQPEQLFLDLLKQVQSQQLAMSQYEYSSLVDIQGWAKLPREQALFETVVVFENYPMDTAAFTQHASLTLDLQRTFVQNSMPLTLRAIPGEQLTLDVLYDTERFTVTQIERVLHDCQLVLQAISATPTLAVAEIMHHLQQAEDQFQQLEEQRLRDANAQKLKTIKRRSVVS